MPKKKLVEEPIEEPKNDEPKVEEPAGIDRLVRVRNAGAPFACNLVAYGYGMRWPTNAVYGIPESVYMKCLADGMDGARA